MISMPIAGAAKVAAAASLFAPTSVLSAAPGDNKKLSKSQARGYCWQTNCCGKTSGSMVFLAAGGLQSPACSHALVGEARGTSCQAVSKTVAAVSSLQRQAGTGKRRFLGGSETPVRYCGSSAPPSSSTFYSSRPHCTEAVVSVGVSSRPMTDPIVLGGSANGITAMLPPEIGAAVSSNSTAENTQKPSNTAAPTKYPETEVKATNIRWQEGVISRCERERLVNQRGSVVWITGLSGSGKSTLAYTLERELVSRGNVCYVLDGDNIRHGLNKNLGFSAEDRAENIRRVGEVARLFVDAGLIVIVSFISPYRVDRDAVRARLNEGEFVEVHMRIPLEVCEQRDPKGLYKLARAGKIKGFTGIDDPYEDPVKPELVMEVSDSVTGTPMMPGDMASRVIEFLEANGRLSSPVECPTDELLG